MAWPFWFIYKPDPHSRKRGTHCNVRYQLLTAMNTDGPFAWSVFVQLLHHQKQLWLSLSGCLFRSKCVWDFVSRSSCWLDITGVVCNWTSKARLTAVKPFNVCHRQIWEFLRCCEGRVVRSSQVQGNRFVGAMHWMRSTFAKVSWGACKFKGSRAFTLHAKTSRLILHPWRCNDHLSFINRCMDAWY